MATEVYKELFTVDGQSNIATFAASAAPAVGKAWVISRLNFSNPGTGAKFALKSNSGKYLTGGGAAGESLADNSHDKWNGLVMNTGDTISFASSNVMSMVAYGAEVTY